MSAHVTPMMAQYLEIKSQAPDALLFYRMGDFYEMFFEDAVAAAEALDIALTKRGKHSGADIPMCGVPHHSAEGYLLTLIRKGFRVAICEQMEDPAEAKKRGSKAVVRREITRLVTPGTLTEDSLLQARQHNFLAAWSEIRGEAALSWADISTGAFFVMTCPQVRLGPELAALSPAEILICDGGPRPDILLETGVAITELHPTSFDSRSAEKRLLDIFKVGSLDAFGQFGRPELSAMGALVEYLDLTQRGQMPRLQPPRLQKAERIMQIDPATRRNLELTQAITGGRAGSLLNTIDETVTAGGGRLLERRLSAPSRKLEIITARHDGVSFFLDEPDVRQQARDLLTQTADIERAVSRLSVERGGPRDMAAIRDTLNRVGALGALSATFDLPSLANHAVDAFGGHESLFDLLDRALVAQPPLLARDGGFVADGFDEDLDAARELRDQGRGVIADLQRRYSDETGIQALKIKHNNVLGYFIETTATHADKMLSPPMSERFIHRQTTANAVRFTTLELSELETKILNSGAHALQIEKAVFERLRTAILEQEPKLADLARGLAELDVMISFAKLASERDWLRPVLSEDRSFDVVAGRHPVVEQALKHSGTPFVANDCALSASDGAAITLLTGPNMAGKSTWLRQNALIAILAQIGAFVPAKSAKIGIVSQVFSRVGASDDLARGRSTFMVEMVETAAILNQADERSLVILDEIGRGTATYDGLSIAWAVLEHLHAENKCRALFATHYHEMTQLADRLDKVKNATVAVKEWKGDVIFLHEVREGAADRSYGVQVAKLAGLPDAVVARAQNVLDALEQGDREGTGSRQALIDDLPLFSVERRRESATAETSKAEERLQSVHPDTLSPRDALALVYELKDLAERRD